MSKANKTKAKASIYGNTHLNPRYPKGKKPLKMNINSRNQLEKAQQKSSAAFQGQDTVNQVNQAKYGNETKKAKGNKARKKKKNKIYQKGENFEKIVPQL